MMYYIVEYAYQIVRALQRRDVDVRVLAPTYPGCCSYDSAAPVPIRRTKPGLDRAGKPGIVGTLAKAASLYALVAAAVQVAREWDPDLIYMPTSYPLANVLRALRAKVVITFHGGEIRRYTKASPVSTVHRKLLLRSCASSDLILANSTYTANLLQRHGVDRSKLCITGCGADWARFNSPPDVAKARKDLGLSGKKVILTLGHLAERKGFDMVLKCLPTIRQKHSDVLYVIAGVGPMEPRLRAMVDELGLRDCVHFAGAVTDHEAVQYMSACDVFAMPNRETRDGSVEGFGIVFLEANACGKPVIAGRSGGAPDAVVDGVTGFLVDPYDFEQVGQAITKLLDDSSLAARLGQQGRQRVEREYKWETVADKAVARMLAAVEHDR